MTTLKSSTSLQGNTYTIRKVLGQGGFGITYLATDNKTGKEVAIKEFYMKDLCNRAEGTSEVSVPSTGSRATVGSFRKKFLKEAYNISSLHHPNIIRIHDVFEENATAYYVMDYVDGGSLNDYIKKKGPMNERKALGYISQVADALDYIHSRHMNHLDIKPDNILNDNGRAVLIDFGVAKRYDADGYETSTSPVGLSHGYAPLEQYKRGGVAEFSPSTDVYSLAATLYKLLTGKTPPDANDILDNGIDTSGINASPKTRKAIERAMRPSRKTRTQTAAEFMAQTGARKKPADNAGDNDELTVIEAEGNDGDAFVISAETAEEAAGHSHAGRQAKDKPARDGKKSKAGCVLYVLMLAAAIAYGIYMAAEGGGLPKWYKGVLIALVFSYKAFCK